MSNNNCNCVLSNETVTVERCNSKEHTIRKQPVDQKNYSKPYEIKENELLGRYLVASRDIKQGEMIIRENPVFIGPRADSCCICLNCYIPLYSCPIIYCSKCEVTPLCGKCKTMKGHDNLECEVLSSAKSRSHKDMLILYICQYILPLRCFLHLKNPLGKDDNNNNFNDFLLMEAHLDERKGTAVWDKCQKSVAQLLQSLGVITKSDDDTEYIQRICGILDVNSFELRGPVGNRGIGERLRGIYLEAALMAHDCVPNTHLSVDNNFQMTIHASVDIKKGQSILFNYTGPLQGTLTRQEFLKEGKYFNCTCKRCLDPTELGTHMSSIKCVKCKIGMISPNIKTDTWQCGNCERTFKSSVMMESINQALNLIEETEKNDKRALEQVLKRLLFTLSPTHSIILDIKQNLVALYRDAEPTKKVLQRKIELCQDLLPVLGIIEPGISRLKGITLYELHIALVMMAERLTGTTEEMKCLTDAEKTLREAVSLLVYEPADSPEGELGRRAMMELKYLRQVIQEQILFSDDDNTNKQNSLKINKNKK